MKYAVHFGTIFSDVILHIFVCAIFFNMFAICNHIFVCAIFFLNMFVILKEKHYENSGTSEIRNDYWNLF